MRANRVITIVVTVVALFVSVELIIPNLVRPPPPYRDSHNTFFSNLRRITEAKQQWAIERKAAPDSWPTERQLLEYLSSHPERPFSNAVPSLAGEQYIINRTDRPALVFFPKEADDFQAGELLTMEDLHNYYDKKFGTQTHR